MKHLPGKLTISRIQSNFEPYDLMRIELHDVTSGVLVTSVTVTMSNFALAITGLACVPCEFDFHPEQVGKRLELKKERVIVPSHFPVTHEAVRIRAREFEVDGWFCSLGESERITKTEEDGVQYVTIPFKRYVGESKEGMGT